MWTEFLPLDGVAALRRHPLLATLTAAVLPFIVTIESVNAVEVVLVRDVLGGSASQFGLSEAVARGAAVLGALLAGSLTSTRARARAILVLLGAVAIAQLVQGLAPGLVGSVALAAAVGLLMGWVNALVFTLLVTDADPAARGSIVALVSAASRSCGPPPPDVRKVPTG